tara:strand:+ start:167 stop:418 length:252 start_codon:yes stop_codon:yes gene_type:complete
MPKAQSCRATLRHHKQHLKGDECCKQQPTNYGTVFLEKRTGTNGTQREYLGSKGNQPNQTTDRNNSRDLNQIGLIFNRHNKLD